MGSVAWLCGVVLFVALLTLQYDSSPLFVPTYETAILTLAFTGILLLDLCFFTPWIWGTESLKILPAQLPLLEKRAPPISQRLRSLLSPREVNGRIRKLVGNVVFVDFMFLVVAVCARFDLFRRIVARPSCTIVTIEPWVPLFVILFDRTVLRTRRIKLHGDKDDPPTPSTYTARNSHLPLLLPLFALSITTTLLLRSTSGQSSTYICALSTPWVTATPFYQLIGALCDAQIIISIYRVLFRFRLDKGPIQRVALLASAALASSLILSIIASMFYVASREHIWSRLWNSPSSGPFAFAIVAAMTITCALQVILKSGLVSVFITVMFTIINVDLLRNGLKHRDMLPLLSPTAILFFLVAAFLSMIYVLAAESTGSSGSRGLIGKWFTRGSRRLIILSILLVALHTCVWFSRPGPHRLGHPIETLISQAEEEHTNFKNAARSSTTLQEAVSKYRQRYGRDPPARFNRWYNYAQLQESQIIDVFDGLHDDLLPFWALTPQEIRDRTAELINSKDNFIGGIFIRHGGVAIGGSFPDSYRWMLESVGHMISPFAKWLPDMDLAINLLEEPRVAVPSKEIDDLLTFGETIRYQSVSIIHHEFDASRAQYWKPLIANPSQSNMADRSFQPIFDEFATIACAADSKAKTTGHWNSKAVCEDCAALHSNVHFVSNWTLARDLCHQPDLANMHGFLMSPGHFKGTHKLLPVFSHSKVSGFNDILYPSVWNYKGKVIYEPDDHWPDVSFDKKEPTLFWRGSSREGFSLNTGVWEGMLRQRAVHLLTNATDSSQSLVFIPEHKIRTGDDDDNENEEDGDARDSYTLRSMTSSSLRDHLSTSVRFADKVENCWGADCDDQENEFASLNTPHIAFQEHWKYKYLLDLDGAGFSARLLPFLMSRSLVFRAGIMRAWWDDRLIAWKHFVPLDMRLREVWSVLAYFAGWRDDGRNVRDAAQDGKKVSWLMPPHEDEAQAIASAGREWAADVLRKEDMEVYMFRLLLEWARLTDNKREELGFRS